MKRIFTIFVAIVLVIGVFAMPVSAAEKNLCKVPEFTDAVLRAGYTFADKLHCVDKTNEKFSYSFVETSKDFVDVSIPLVIGKQISHKVFPKDLFAEYPAALKDGSAWKVGKALTENEIKVAKETDKNLYHQVPNADFDEIYFSLFDSTVREHSYVEMFAQAKGNVFGFDNKDGYYYIPAMEYCLKSDGNGGFESAKYETNIYGYVALGGGSYDVYATVDDVAAGKTLGYVKYVLKYDGKTAVKYVSVEELDAKPELDTIILPTTEDKDIPDESTEKKEEETKPEDGKKDDDTKSYPDVKDTNAWYYKPVMYATEQGIFSGYANGKFGVNDNILRQDFVLTLAKYSKDDLASYKNSNKFSDVKDSDYFTAAIMWGAQKEIVAGYENGKFGVGDKLTREQLVAFLYKYCQYKGLDVKTTTTADSYKNYSDFDKISDWAKDAMIWALEKKIISGKDGKLIAPLDFCTRGETATIFYAIDTNGLFK